MKMVRFPIYFNHWQDSPAFSIHPMILEPSRQNHRYTALNSTQLRRWALKTAVPSILPRQLVWKLPPHAFFRGGTPQPPLYTHSCNRSIEINKRQKNYFFMAGTLYSRAFPKREDEMVCFEQLHSSVRSCPLWGTNKRNRPRIWPKGPGSIKGLSLVNNRGT